MGRRDKTHDSWQIHGGSQIIAGQLYISGLDWLSIGFDLFICRGHLLLNHSIQRHWTFEPPILVRRSCQREIWMCTALRRDTTYCVLETLKLTPSPNTTHSSSQHSQSCDGQLRWDRNYSASIVHHRKPPSSTGLFEGLYVQGRDVATPRVGNQSNRLSVYCHLGMELTSLNSRKASD